MDNLDNFFSQTKQKQKQQKNEIFVFLCFANPTPDIG